MLQRKSFQTLMLSAVVILVICLLAAAISLTTQKPIDNRDAKPAGLPGIQVTVEGTTEGTIIRGWDPKTKKAVDLTETTQYKGEARTKMVDKLSPQLRQADPGANAAPDIVFTDGKQRIKGAAHDVSMASIRNMK